MANVFLKFLDNTKRLVIVVSNTIRPKLVIFCNIIVFNNKSKVKGAHNKKIRKKNVDLPCSPPPKTIKKEAK